MSEFAQAETGGTREWALVPNFPKDAFSGVGEYYARYREPYPKELVDDLNARAGTSGDGRLLDLACGTGQVAIPMSSSFREVWAVDQEPEMISVGMEFAHRVGIDNIRWLAGRAEDLDAPPGYFEMVAVGNAFHRLDRRMIAQKARVWLSPERFLVVMGSTLARGEEWRRIVRDVVNQWKPGGDAPRPTEGPSQPKLTHEAVLNSMGFTTTVREFVTPYTWTLDSVIGRVYSGSNTSKDSFGDRAEAFEADLRRALLDYDERGSYREDITFFYILAKAP